MQSVPFSLAVRSIQLARVSVCELRVGESWGHNTHSGPPQGCLSGSSKLQVRKGGRLAQGHMSERAWGLAQLPPLVFLRCWGLHI